MIPLVGIVYQTEAHTSLVAHLLEAHLIVPAAEFNIRVPEIIYVLHKEIVGNACYAVFAEKPVSLSFTVKRFQLVIAVCHDLYAGFGEFFHMLAHAEHTSAGQEYIYLMLYAEIKAVRRVFIGRENGLREEFVAHFLIYRVGAFVAPDDKEIVLSLFYKLDDMISGAEPMV